MSVRFVSYLFRLPIGLNRSNGRFAALDQPADNREEEEDYLSSLSFFYSKIIFEPFNLYLISPFRYRYLSCRRKGWKRREETSGLIICSLLSNFTVDDTNPSSPSLFFPLSLLLFFLAVSTFN